MLVPFKHIQIGEYFQLEYMDLDCKKISISSYKVIGGPGITTNVNPEAIVKSLDKPTTYYAI